MFVSKFKLKLLMNFKNLFRKEQPRVVNSTTLNQSVSSILSSFNMVINQLNDVIIDAKKQADIKQKEIEAATIEKEALENIASKNEQIVTKFKDLLN